MFAVEALFFRITDEVSASIECFRSALATLERGHQLTVLHDGKSSWLMVKGRIDLCRGEQQVFDDALKVSGLRELITITWDDQWSWTTYRHLDLDGELRYFVLNPEPDEGQTPWIADVGAKETWEVYTDAPDDSDLQRMAAFFQLPGITHSGRLEFPDEWELHQELLVVGKGPVVPPTPIDPESALGLMKRASDGEKLSIPEALRLMQSAYAPLSVKHVSDAMRTYSVYAPKRRWFRKRASLRGPKGQKLVPVLSSLHQVPGVSSTQLDQDFAPLFVLELIDQLKRDEGLIFDPLQKDASLQIDPEDVPNFRRMIASGSV